MLFTQIVTLVLGLTLTGSPVVVQANLASLEQQQGQMGALMTALANLGQADHKRLDKIENTLETLVGLLQKPKDGDVAPYDPKKLPALPKIPSPPPASAVAINNTISDFNEFMKNRGVDTGLTLDKKDSEIGQLTNTVKDLTNAMDALMKRIEKQDAHIKELEESIKKGLDKTKDQETKIVAGTDARIDALVNSTNHIMGVLNGMEPYLRTRGPAIKCYECTTKVDQRCIAPIHTQMPLTQCSAPDALITSCVKAETHEGGKVIVTRACSQPRTDVCSALTGSGIPVARCVRCYADGCNDALGVQPSTLLMFIASVAVLVATLRQDILHTFSLP